MTKHEKAENLLREIDKSEINWIIESHSSALKSDTYMMNLYKGKDEVEYNYHKNQAEDRKE